MPRLRRKLLPLIAQALQLNDVPSLQDIRPWHAQAPDKPPSLNISVRQNASSNGARPLALIVPQSFCPRSSCRTSTLGTPRLKAWPVRCKARQRLCASDQGEVAPCIHMQKLPKRSKATSNRQPMCTLQHEVCPQNRSYTPLIAHRPRRGRSPIHRHASRLPTLGQEQ